VIDELDELPGAISDINERLAHGGNRCVEQG